MGFLRGRLSCQDCPESLLISLSRGLQAHSVLGQRSTRLPSAFLCQVCTKVWRHGGNVRGSGDTVAALKLMVGTRAEIKAEPGSQAFASGELIGDGEWPPPLRSQLPGPCSAWEASSARGFPVTNFLFSGVRCCQIAPSKPSLNRTSKLLGHALLKATQVPSSQRHPQASHLPQASQRLITLELTVQSLEELEGQTSY